MFGSSLRQVVCMLMSYLRYLCLLAHSGVPHILCCVFALFFVVLCTLCCQFLWVVQFLLPLPYFIFFKIVLSTYASIKLYCIIDCLVKYVSNYSDSIVN